MYIAYQFVHDVSRQNIVYDKACALQKNTADTLRKSVGRVLLQKTVAAIGMNKDYDS